MDKHNVVIPRGGKQALLKAHEVTIMRLRSMGYSYQQICDELARKELSVTKSTIRQFILKKEKGVK